MATTTANIGFEKQIWDAACVLRGNMDASEYKNIVLGLIFLKYISDRFEERYQALVAEGDGFEEDIDEYTAEGIFFVPADARWEVISKAAHTPEVGQVIDDAMRAIEKENPRLKDILPKNFARPELDKGRLGDVVDLFTNIQMIEHGDEKEETVREMQPDQTLIEQLPGRLHNATARGKETDCVTRSFAPKCGIAEDPVCGSAHCQVADYWSKMLRKKDIVAYQASKRGGTLYCEQTGDGRIKISGKAVLFAVSEVQI